LQRRAEKYAYFSSVNHVPDSITLLNYAGEYAGGLVFYVQGDNLFCKNPERDNKIFNLKYFSRDHFTLDENVKVEFVRSPYGDVNGLKMLWVNGTITFKPTVKFLNVRKDLWMANYRKIGTLKKGVPKEILTKYTGNYEDLSFYVEDEKLFCKNGERESRIFELQPIDENQFVLDENVQVEFVEDVSNEVIGINMNWRTGAGSYKSKEL
jgi:hypothetical protein